MDKPSSKLKSSNVVFKLIPKAASAVNFHSFPFSPGRENNNNHNKHRQTDHHTGKSRTFSGPLRVSMIPDEARTKSKNSSFVTEEPTSPKVSCIGQIKHKKKLKKELAKLNLNRAEIPEPIKRPSAIQRMFTTAKLGKMKSSTAAASGDHHFDKPPLPDRAPCARQMKRFSSGRGGALANFDWTAQVAPLDGERGTYHSDEDWSETENDQRDAPIKEVGPLQPRKEVNLWKRRTMVPPIPLQLNIMATP